MTWLGVVVTSSIKKTLPFFLKYFFVLQKLLIFGLYNNKINRKMYQTKYFKNLRIDNNKVISYTTCVATIDHAHKQVIQLGWWSVTTQKHINYVARELGYIIVECNLGRKNF